MDLPDNFIDAHFLTGFESTYMPGVGTDVLEGTRHNERFRPDFELVSALGIRRLRYPASWNYVQKQPGQWDWALLDDKMAALREFGLTPILDLVHHTALPDALLPDGFAAPDFPDRLEEFAARCGERYPWVTQYTLFNEPYLTTQFCGEFGIWFPQHTGTESFVAMMLNVARAIVRSAKVLRRIVPGVRFMHPDTCEHHRPLDPHNAEAVARAEFANAKRFIFDDLLRGWIKPDHALHGYMRNNGACDADLEWFADKACPIDVRGLDYYRQSEWDTVSDGPNRWAEQRAGFAAVAADYIERYNLPVMLSETNFFGTSEERCEWMRHMLDEYARLARQYPQVQGFCWFPFVSSTDFQHMLMQYRNDVDPVGIYDLGPDRWERVPTALVSLIRDMRPVVT